MSSSAPAIAAMGWRVVALTVLALGCATNASAQRTPTAVEYVKAAGGDARIVAAKFSCGNRPTVLHSGSMTMGPPQR